MHKETTVNPTSPSLMYSECWEVDYLCNRYGLSRNIVRSHLGDRARMEQEAERLAKYERLH
jgi:hypothetical protein